MSAAVDELTKPLGLDRRPAAPRLRLPLAPALAAATAATLVVLVGAAAFTSDPLGGEPHAVAAIAAAPPPAPSGARDEALRNVAATPAAAERSAAEVEAASGVAVVRPADAAAPGSLVIRVPDADGPVRLEPAPDRRLVERGRHGVLPRIGADGARPADVYARPAGSLPGGARPVARVAVLVTGLGINPGATAEAVAKLAAPVTLAFAPYGGDLERQAARARAEGHEVMLQVPMEPFDYPDNDPGPHTLTVRAKPQEVQDRLHWVMSRFSGYTGIVNFMGAKLTSDEAALAPILREVGARGLLVLDDGSSSRSVIERVGAGVRTATARADIVLDAVPRPEAIDRELARLEETARQRGVAVATASALPVTVDRIARWARELESRQILLVPVSAAFGREGRS